MPFMQSINPATEEKLAEFPVLSPEAAFEEARKSRQAAGAWAQLPLADRLHFIQNASILLRKNAHRYGELMTQEMGKPIAQAVAEAEKCAWACEYYVENAARFLVDESIPTGAKQSYIMFQPLGTILGVMPWNFPFWQVFRFAVPTLISGNTCVLKHASNVPQCALEIEKLFREAGLPDQVFKTLLIRPDVASAIIQSDLVEGVSFTGSTDAGARIGELAGRHIKKAVLELGGSDPFIVLDDADIAAAVKSGVTARFQNSGQSCIAAKRFIVHEKVAEAFTASFVEATQRLVVGNPLDEKVQIGPLAKSDLRDTLVSQLQAAVSKGAKVLAGGHRVEGRGYFFEPTVLQVRKDNPVLLQEELFGPVASILVAKDDEETLQIANSIPYGLGASVWTADSNRAQYFVRNLQAGFVAVNAMVKSDPRLPFGGVKKSGLGRELGLFGIQEFVNIKSVVIQ